MLLACNDCCGAATCNLTVTVKGCSGLNVAGATVTATAGGTTYTATSNSSGNATLAVPSGTYTVSGSYGSRFNPYSTTVTVACPGGGSTILFLSAATGYHCCSGCAIPYKDTLQITGTFGSVNVTWNSTNGDWEGSTPVSTNQLMACNGSNANCAGSPVSGNVTTSFFVTCPGSSTGQFGVTVLAPLCACAGGGCYYDAGCSGGLAAGACLNGVQAAGSDGGCSSSLPLSLTVPLTWGVAAGVCTVVPPPGYLFSGSVTVVEV